MLRMVYKAATGVTLEELEAAVQMKLDEGWMCSGSAFYGISKSRGIFIQPMVVNTTKEKK